MAATTTSASAAVTHGHTGRLRRRTPVDRRPLGGPYSYGGNPPVAPCSWVWPIGSIRLVPPAYVLAGRIWAATGKPERARWMSPRISPADWYLSAGSFSIARSTLASAHLGSWGSTLVGGTGSSRTCW